MEKRTDQKKQRGEEFKNKMQKMLALFFCFALLIFFITAADMSTRRMIMLDDDRYAMAVSLQENNLLRLDIAGEKYVMNIEPVVRITNNVISISKKYYENIVSAIKEKI